VVHFIMMTTLADFDPNDPDPLQRLITLDCGHAFTVDTLDGEWKPLIPAIRR
jgi:hypothetical protein